VHGNLDTGISRLGAASLAIGNGTAGDFTGTLKLATLNINAGTNNGSILDIQSNSIEFAVQLNGFAYLGTITNHPFVFFTHNGNGNLVLGVDGGASVGTIHPSTGAGNLAITGGNLEFTASAASTTIDTNISRLGAASLAIGNGTAGNTTGQITATTFTVAASGAAPTSAGTAGTVGQIIANGGKLYFCSATGAAGAATWNTITLVPIL
jgi:hypothetical protein